VNQEEIEPIENVELEVKDTQSKLPKSNTLKVGRRTAMVYTGAAILIVVVGLRTLLQMADEGFGIGEYVAIGALLIEFSVLLLYAFTIYSVSKDDAKKEGFQAKPDDMPAVALQLKHLSDEVIQEIKTMREETARLHEIYNKDLPSITNELGQFATDFRASTKGIEELTNQSMIQSKEMREETARLHEIYNKDLPSITNELRQLSTDFRVSTKGIEELTNQSMIQSKEMREETARLHEIYNKDLPSITNELRQLSTDFRASTKGIEELTTQSIIQSKEMRDSMGQAIEASRSQSQENLVQSIIEQLIDQLKSNENLLTQNVQQVSALTKGIREVIEEQVTLRIRQELQHLLSSPLVNKSGR